MEILNYRQALDDLKDNNKMQINLMTILADDYNSYSKEIIDVIAQQIEKVCLNFFFSKFEIFHKFISFFFFSHYFFKEN